MHPYENISIRYCSLGRRNVMRSLSLLRVLKMALGGSLGGIITWLILDPTYRASESGLGSMARGLSDTFASAFIAGATVGFSIGVFLILADEIQSLNFLRIGSMSLRGAAAGILGGLVGGVCAQILYTVFMSVIGVALLLMGPAAKPFVVFARSISWALMGAGAGVCPGLVAKSPRRVRQGVIGGILGGGLGGFLFDGLAAATQGGSASRAVGFVCMGAAIGAAVSFIEEVGKDAWLTVLTGAKEGRSYILSKPQTTIGRNEMADIPLFGDSTVLSTHAVLTKSGGPVSINAASGSSIQVNSQNTQGAYLADGDIIGIGKHKLRFSTTMARVNVNRSPVPQNQYSQPQQAYSIPQQADTPSTVATRLQAATGPHSGVVYALASGGGPMTVGRDPGCDVALPKDGMASRFHATLLWDGKSWRIEDNGSTNGVYVNGVRVSGEAIRPGMEIGIGQTILKAI